MRLVAFERLILLNILPREGDYRTLRQLRELREELAFSDAEQAALEFRPGDEPGLLHWRKDADQPKDVHIGEVLLGVIADVLRSLESRKKLHEEHMGLYERFVLEQDPVAQAEQIAAGRE